MLPTTRHHTLKYVAALPWKLKNQKFALGMHVNMFQV